MALMDTVASSLRVTLKLVLLSFGLICAYHGNIRLHTGATVYFIAWIVSLILVAFDNVIIYPRFRSPLRKLPLVRVSQRDSPWVDNAKR
jgi:hypothetical protein